MTSRHTSFAAGAAVDQRRLCHAVVHLHGEANIYGQRVDDAGADEATSQNGSPVRGVGLAGVGPDSTVLVLGAGTIGLCAALVLGGIAQGRTATAARP